MKQASTSVLLVLMLTTAPNSSDPLFRCSMMQSSKRRGERDAMAHVCNLSIRRLRGKDFKFEVSLDSYIVRTSQKQTKTPTTGVTAHTSNPSSKKVEDSRSSLRSAFLGYIEFQASLGYTARICLNK